MSLRLPYSSSAITYFNLSLNDKFIGTILTGSTYSIVFTSDTSSVTKTTAIIDSSLYPDKYNRFYLITGTGNTSEVELDEGMWRYDVYTWSDRTTKTNILEFGMCYVYDSPIRVENTPTKTTYQEDKTKFVYKK